MSEQIVAEPTDLRCARCGDLISNCECCDQPDCPEALCYECVAVALGETMAQPHQHGG
jgi:hypothetical protein